MAEVTSTPKVYTVEQLMQLVSTGSCAVAQPGDDNKVCADKTDAAFLDPSTLKRLGTSRVRFTVKNTETTAKYLGMGEALKSPGLTPLYCGSVFSGKEDVNFPGFFVGDSCIALAAGPNALAFQAAQQRNPRLLVSGFAFVRVDNSDPLLAEDMQFERFNPANGKCNTEQVSPECEACPGNNNSNLVTVRYDMGLAASDERNAWGILIPGTPENAVAKTYTVDVDFAFTEGAYGYVPITGGGLGCK